MKAGGFALLLAALAACSSPTQRCDFTNCNGCCDGLGSCQPGATTSACGVGGAFCQVCPAGVCRFGQCGFIGFDAGPPCDSVTCPNGCCLGSQCFSFPIQSNSLCGSFGQFCMQCPFGQSCFNGSCVRTSCAVTCANGCCDGDGGCFTSQDSLHCGIGGQLCVTCASGVCTAGFCMTDGGTCDSTNCLGCCSGSVCIGFANQNNNQCGLSGAACASCAGGGTCQVGQCFGVVCGPSNCAGCCDGPACIDVPLQRDFACGAGGAGCSQCSSGSTCQSGQCLPACGPQDCNGCCAASTCVVLASESNAQCGHAGGACNPCTGTTTCSDAGICR